MKKIIFGMILGLLVMVFTACGGGGSSSSLPKMDNSKVGGIEITDGYYAGENVLFAGTKIVGNWSFYQLEESKSVNATFRNDGDARIENKDYSYGVSKDGRKISATSYIVPTTIEYKGIKKDFLKSEDASGKITFYDCYDIEWIDNYGIYNLIMCP